MSKTDSYIDKSRMLKVFTFKGKVDGVGWGCWVLGFRGGGEGWRQTEREKPNVLTTEVIKSRTCTKRLRERERESEGGLGMYL